MYLLSFINSFHRYRCLRHFHSLHSLQRTSSTQDVIQSDEVPTSSNQGAIVVGIDNFMQPPPYTDDDEYRKDNPPPRYEECLAITNGACSSSSTQNITIQNTSTPVTTTNTRTENETVILATSTESQPL